MSSKIAQIKPLIVSARIVQPVLGIVHTLTPSPLAVSVTIKTSHGTPIQPSPLHVTVTKVTPTHT